MQGVLHCFGMVGFSCRVGTRNFSSALAGFIGPVQNIFFLTVHYLNSCVTIAQKAGPAVVLGRLSLIMCICFLLQQLSAWFDS
jgi:hypothetical protein